MANNLSIKQGDTFAPLAAYTDNAGVPIDLTNIQIASQVRDGDGNLIATLTITKLPEQGNYTLSSPTQNWPVNRQLSMDIRYIQSGAIIHTETLSFRVSPAQTRN